MLCVCNEACFQLVRDIVKPLPVSIDTRVAMLIERSCAAELYSC